MESGAVYNETTEPQTKAPRRPFGCTLRHLRLWKSATKAGQAILSLLAVIFEILVEQCGSVVDFFEFISCTAFLLSLVVLCVYCTDLYTTFGEDKIQKVNFWVMPVTGGFFLLASIVLAAVNSGSAFEKAASAFGFLASGAFLAEFIIECFYSRRKNVDGSSKNPGNTQTPKCGRLLNEQS